MSACCCLRRSCPRPALLLFLAVLVSVSPSCLAVGLSVQTCGSPVPGYTTANLSAAGTWYLQQPTHYCLGDQQDNVTCAFLFAFCRDINRNDVSIFPLPDACVGQSVCMVTSSGTVANGWSLGVYDPTDNPFIRHQIGAISEFDANFRNGYSSNCGKYGTLVTFECDKNYPWEAAHIPNESEPPPKALISFAIDTVNCIYKFRFRYAGACYKLQSAGPIKYLSAGSILLILAACTLAIYCGLGAAINYSAGARGRQVVPNSDTWVHMPENVLDGFAYSVAVVTCQSGRAAPVSITEQGSVSAGSEKGSYQSI